MRLWEAGLELLRAWPGMHVDCRSVFIESMRWQYWAGWRDAKVLFGDGMVILEHRVAELIWR